jgi:2-C-methyl-D-erythritol 4-phosphate cytidylyltransferase
VTAAAVILAGGSGTRVGARHNKVYLPLAGRRLVSWSVNAFADAGVGRLILVTRAAEMAEAREVMAREVDAAVEIIEGGSTRHGSEHAALRHLAPDIISETVDVVAIHDGARPLLSVRLVRTVLAAARAYGGAVPALPVEDLAEQTDRELVLSADFGSVMRVQTPQAFRAGPLLAAYDQAYLQGFTGSDTAACVERFSSLPVFCLDGDVRNLKVTFPQDLFLAEQLLADADYNLS